MLVLSRNIDQKIFIILPDLRQIEVMLVDVSHSGRARLGFVAPPDILILRDDVVRKAKAEHEELY